MATITRDDVQRLAIQIATDLCREDPPAVRGDIAKVAAAVGNAIVANFSEEASIRREAERTLETLGAREPTLDRGKLLHGLVERIAAKRGFVL